MGPLPSDKYLSYFGVIKSAFEAQQDKKGELSKVSGGGGGCMWIVLLLTQGNAIFLICTKLPRIVSCSWGARSREKQLMSVAFVFIQCLQVMFREDVLHGLGLAVS